MDARIKIKRIAYATYTHSDMAYTKQFLTDFGLTEVCVMDKRHYFRGYGDLPYIYIAEEGEQDEAVFQGMAFEVESEEELQRASRLKVVGACQYCGMLFSWLTSLRFITQGATGIRELDGPGGGLATTLYDPIGLAVHLVYGTQLRQVDLPSDPTLPANQGLSDNRAKARPPGSFQRFDTTSSVPVHKLGHYVLYLPDFQV
ncbi:hypothetical protein EMMF5_005048 [Cystobasidiomycetes sp. EMM_F5]